MAVAAGSRLPLALLAAGVLLALPLHAEEIWRIDPEPSAGRFRVWVFATFPVSGRFDDVTGRVAIDRARGTARIEAAIDARTVELRSARQTRWARSEEFFDAARHPHIRFASQPLPLARLARGGMLDGSLDLRGARREVHFRIAPSSCGKAEQATRCTVEVEGSIQRSEFGMSARRGAVSDRVSLHFSIVAEPG